MRRATAAAVATLPLLLASATASAQGLLAALPGEGQLTACAAATGCDGRERLRWAARTEAGDAQAQFDLGLQFDLGKDVERNPTLAYQWYRRAAEAGFAAAQFNVAVMHDTGDGVPRNAATAALWYARAAAHGNHRAQFNLAQLYSGGDGVPRNHDLAAAWYRAAASALPAAADRLTALRRTMTVAAAATARDARVGGGAGLPGPVQPTFPLPGSSVSRSGPAASIEFVWTAPPQPTPVRFFLQVLRLGAADGQHEVFAAYLDESSVLVPLPEGPGSYAWRVYAVGGAARRYAPSEWMRFQVSPAA